MSLQTANLGIMTSAKFVDLTLASKAVGGIAGKLKGRGSNMAGIDNALRAWEKNCHRPNLATAQKLALVNDINFECAKWLKRKRDKSTVIATQRKQVIGNLKQSLQAPLQFLKKKSQHASGNPKYRSPTKAMAGNYAMERRHYMEGNKQSNPFSATLVDGEGGREFKDMDYDEFKNTAGGMRNNSVIYLNRARRMDVMLMVEGGRFFRADGQVAKSDGNANCYYADPYAVDKYGNLYSVQLGAMKKEKVGLGQMNHSTFCAGREVICAGTIAFDDQGHLIYLSNLSGHYKPNRAHMGWYLRMLAGERVDLQNVCVGAMNAAGTGVEHIRCTSFLNSLTSPQDWPTLSPGGTMAVVGGKNVENPG